MVEDEDAAGLQVIVDPRDLNHLYRQTPALHQRDFSGDGFEWIDPGLSQPSVSVNLTGFLVPDGFAAKMTAAGARAMACERRRPICSAMITKKAAPSSIWLSELRRSMGS